MSGISEARLARWGRRLRRVAGPDVHAARDGDSVLLTGFAPTWEAKVAAGYLAARLGSRGVLNDLRVPGIDEAPMSRPDDSDASLEGRRFDVVVVGGGVIGCAVARELVRYDLSVALLEKEYDLAMQATGRNDGMIHPGFAPSPGTRKAHYNVRGNRMYDRWAEELDFEFRRPGSIVLFDNPLKMLLIPLFRRRCRKNGVDGAWRRLSRREVRRLEPTVTRKQWGGFLLPSAGIVSPYRVTIALAENAVVNGAHLHLKTVVTGMDLHGDRITSISTNRGRLEAGCVVNAAGVWADLVAGYAGDRFFSIHGRKGTDAILDRDCADRQNHILGMPSLIKGRRRHSKGGGLVPCVEGNILLGPTAQEVPDREDYSTDAEVFRHLLKQLELNRSLDRAQVISYYSGVRAASWEEDFIVEPSLRVANLVHAAAIQSPGLASAPAIAEDVSRMVRDILERDGREVRRREGFDPIRRGIPRVKDLSREERNALIRRDPAYGDIVCRCEEISRGEIRDALRSPVPATTLDGVKRRVRAGAGRCHGGFCQPRVLLEMAREQGVDATEITKKNGRSRILAAALDGESV